MDLIVTQHGFTQGLTRRDFLKAGGGLVVSFTVPGCAIRDFFSEPSLPAAGGVWPAKVDPAALDSWLRIGADGNVTASVGKIEAGMGIGTAFAQIVAGELDVPPERVTIVMGGTATTVDQRGPGSSNGITHGGAALRRAGAEGRAVLLALAAERFKLPVEELRVRDGVVFAASDPSKHVSYGELIGGREFGVTVSERPRTKDPKDYSVAGKPVPR